MKLKRFLLRYYPPGIILEYEKGGALKTKSIDLLDLSPETDTEELISEIRKSEPLITASRVDQVKLLILRLQEKLGQQDNRRFYLFKALQAHILPLTNVAFNKSGSRFITGSYDRTCKIWDTASGEELHTLEGHRNVVYAITFNNPYGDKIATGSFDKTCRLWSVETGKCFHTFRGHTAEIVCLAFNPQSTLVATGSMDTTAKLWDIQTGEEVSTLTVWEAASGKCMATLAGHEDEVLDVCFDYTGQLIATASADGTARVYSAASYQCISRLESHEGEISKICFNAQGSRVLTASADKTARLWDVQSGVCLQVLEGHTDEIFSSAFNYEGDTIITGSKDNTCRIWR
ncbi:dynein assembly factor with WDR repeat domains 1 isoform X3 [Salvelinus fontinalis]|uniref:dynein assembly factor with WDR repeat domains 1 isoform X3 n=1 Tax=Salvelinus fontinalis TaxID=8038 RepID=UPI002484ED56|nr:dynein assembly factor with WDR repeat domains 1 isoform X3 [Salvelinus fontinalis]